MFFLEFIKDYWLLFGAAVIALMIVRAIFRAMFKAALLIVIAGLVLFYFFGYSPSQLINTGQTAAGAVSEVFQSTVKPLVQKEIKDAKYTFHPDGTYEAKTEHFRLVGKKGDPNGTVYYGEHSFTINISDLGDIVQKQILERVNAGK